MLAVSLLAVQQVHAESSQGGPSVAEALAGKSPEGETCEEAANSGTYAASRGSSAAAGGCPVTGAPAASASPSGEYPSHGSDTHGCPVGGSGGPFSEPTKQSWPPTPGKSDFYASDTDPTEEGLSTVTVKSNIPRSREPKEGEELDPNETWNFPSPQRFFNALRRKGWNEVDPKDVQVIVSIHNTMNEYTWGKVMEYESLHSDECCQSKLRRFYRVFGKPEELSPKSRLLHLVGYNRPFDRHDWFIDRCGREVRYVIDYYEGPADPVTGAPGVYVDVRPAWDSFENVWDRCRMWWREQFGEDQAAAAAAAGKGSTRT